MEDAKATLGVSAEARRNSIELIDGAKKILDDKISVARRAGSNEQAKAFKKLKNELIAEADRQVPIYKEARKIFSSFASIEDAQQLGLQFTKQTPEQLKRTLSTMDNTQKEAFKIGVRENLQRIVSKTSDQADPAKRIFGSEFKRDQLKTIFGDGNQFEKFSKAMREEIRGAETKFKVLGGSRTDINQTDDGRFIVAAADAARQGVTRIAVDAIAQAAKRRYIGLNAKSAKDLAVILTDRDAGIEALERLIASVPKSQKIIVGDAVDELAPALGLTGLGLAGAAVE